MRFSTLILITDWLVSQLFWSMYIAAIYKNFVKFHQFTKNFSQSLQTRINTSFYESDNKYYVNHIEQSRINTSFYNWSMHSRARVYAYVCARAR